MLSGFTPITSRKASLDCTWGWHSHLILGSIWWTCTEPSLWGNPPHLLLFVAPTPPCHPGSRSHGHCHSGCDAHAPTQLHGPVTQRSNRGVPHFRRKDSHGPSWNPHQSIEDYWKPPSQFLVRGPRLNPSPAPPNPHVVFLLSAPGLQLLASVEHVRPNQPSWPMDQHRRVQLDGKDGHQKHLDRRDSIEPIPWELYLHLSHLHHLHLQPSLTSD